MVINFTTITGTAGSTGPANLQMDQGKRKWVAFSFRNVAKGSLFFIMTFGCLQPAGPVSHPKMLGRKDPKSSTLKSCTRLPQVA
jgi:hypothetical protein